MKKLLAIMLATSGVLFVVAGVNAQCRTVVRVQQQAYQTHAAYQAHAYVAPLAAVYQAIPVYSVGYTPDNKEELQLLRIQLLQFQQQFLTFQQQQLQPVPQQLPAPREPFRDTPRQQLFPQPPAMPPALPPAQKLGAAANHPAIAIMNKACASCHTDVTAKGKGGGFVLFASGGIAQLSDRQGFNISREIFSGRMPKNAKMSDEEVGQIMDWLDTVK